MKRVVFVCFMVLSTMSLFAQEEAPAAASAAPAQYGYVSFNALFERMTEYAEAKVAFAQLKEKYEAEAKRAEEEFQRKFAEFLQGQKDFPASIMQKRQVELQELMEKSVSFRQESQRLLRKAEKEMQAPILQKLTASIQAVAAERNLMFVLNTDDNAVPFVNPQMGVDISELVLQKLGLASAYSNPDAAK